MKHASLIEFEIAELAAALQPFYILGGNNVQQDIWKILDLAGPEGARRVIAAFDENRIQTWTYWEPSGRCGCFLGHAFEAPGWKITEEIGLSTPRPVESVLFSRAAWPLLRQACVLWLRDRGYAA